LQPPVVNNGEHLAGRQTVVLFVHPDHRLSGRHGIALLLVESHHPSDRLSVDVYTGSGDERPGDGDGRGEGFYVHVENTHLHRSRLGSAGEVCLLAAASREAA
jgi:hypothetical protein